MTTRIMIDTNIHDKVEADKELKLKLEKFIEEKKIVILTTHVQQDELPEHLKNNVEREEITTEGFVLGISRLGQAKLGNGSQDERDVLQAEKIPTAGGIWGVSKYGQAKYGDASHSGIGIDDVRGPKGSHSKDALIATTASESADIFVTEDKRLLNRLRKLPVKCNILTFAEFKKLIRAL